MINLIERLDVPSLDFIRSQKIVGIKIPTVVIHDDGFLPSELDSPIKYYCGFTKKGQPLYFDKLPLPKFWRIAATGSKAEVFDIDKKRAEVFYKKNDNSRLIKEVHWLNNAGQISWIDHYNSDGIRYAQTFYNNQQPVVRKYYDTNGKVVIENNITVGDFYLNYQGIKRHFQNLIDFVIYYLKDYGYQLDHIFYNTLNESLSVSLNLGEPGIDTLFWHEAGNQELPGNMNYLMNVKTRTKHIVYQRYDEWLKNKKIIPSDTGNVDFQYMGMVYPHPRSNKMRPKALIFTNSDQIEKLKELVTGMPNIHFTIAAITEMSDKLLAFGGYSNVTLYPVVKPKRIKSLIKENDFYFDINYGNEILETVKKFV
ncbi:MAG: accessory Sec system glycosylation chaperone GtfB [Lactobacillus crispatus]|jgi:accessory Sec system glycosyltransferase GtfB|nr:accessory Sec system glycosylation chaperone GtfB [Lactobacillus crispatus]MCI1336057.1 accessory Sec system glycosylation chaperone GtfB [Lactobacillus crispatus]MCI1365547.1 accessory Sec system glycosylation chaperone GtfB [Lactobacillus crispatus]MCI1494507.1 accessory Sec system glycosylation chaperone GtfB [Lactobacillus crispatus]MCI1538241.1 accessory Sec system glycosylation chaperone GtfB [Lactobacillus crispatus]